MHPFLVRLAARAASRVASRLAPLALLAAAAGSLGAQRAPAPSSATTRATIFDVTPYAGYVRFGHYLDGPLGTSLRSANAPVLGAQLGLAMGPNVGLVGNVAYGSADLQVGVPILGGIDVGTSKHLLYDADIELRAPMPGRSQTVTPFVQAGVGAITTKLENALVNTSSTNVAFNGGAGLDVSVGRGFGVRAMVKDYVGRFDGSNGTGVPVKGDITHNVAGSLGVRLSF